ncbi:MAG TPA: nascent polypeptide-associated complex protein [Candidatus Nanoarchaeia archaeon]|nr:nascent polypeptide-associated complex protein [Candidatus Nanoarchaeia archaeon]
MFPGMNPRDMQKAMQRMGIKQEDIPATEVIIRTADKELVITDPQVAKIKMMGQESFQISGQVHERVKTVEMSAEDIQAVVDQAGCTAEEAEQALKNAGGDIAAAILTLQK